MHAPDCLPDDLEHAVLIGRVWLDHPTDGPAVVVVRDGQLFDITRHAVTVADLFERADLLALVRGAAGTPLGSARALLAAALAG